MDTSSKVTTEPEYIVDSEGRRTKVILSVEAYEALLEASQRRKIPQREFSSLGAGEEASLQGAQARDLIAEAWKER